MDPHLIVAEFVAGASVQALANTHGLSTDAVEEVLRVYGNWRQREEEE